MEEPINVKNMSRPPMTETFNNEAPQEDNPYIETEHNGNKVYVCTFPNCSKAFRYQSQANRHSIVHNKDRPFPCTYKGCNKSFKRADILESHMLLHTDNLPYACTEPGCNRKFASKPSLKYHQASHSTHQVLKCEAEGCGKTFLQYALLKKHIKAIHTGDLPPPDSPTEEEETPINPETEKQFREFLASPYNKSEWKVMAEIRRNQQKEEYCRQFFNYVIKKMKTLEEQARNANQQGTQMNNDNFPDTLSQNSFSEFARFTEQFDCDQFKLPEFFKETTDNAL